MHDYFDLQLTFADVLSVKLERPLAESVLRHTNLFRRLGLGNPEQAASSEAWKNYTVRLDSLETHEDRLAWTVEFYKHCPQESLSADQKIFGCFQLELRDDGRIVRAHFANANNDELSPLHSSKVQQRQAELRELFAFVKANYPSAKQVMGVSWLYNFEAYRRLFPLAYGDSRVVRTGITRFQGSSSWGQFLDYKGAIKAAPRGAFLKNLKQLDANFDASKIWQVFPLATYVVSLPVQAFYTYFDV